MSLNLVSPGVKVREVDLTIGRVDAANDQVGAIAGPFVKGPVDVPVLIETEQDLLATFGKPVDTDAQYDYWMSASSYLSYGGTLRVIRTDDDQLNNANSGVSADSVTLKIKGYEDYENSYNNATTWHYAAKNPGRWANKLKVCTIDAFADQVITVSSTAGVNIGMGVTQSLEGKTAAGIGITEALGGFLRGIITGVGTDSGLETNQISVNITDTVNAAGVSTAVTYQQGGVFSFDAPTTTLVTSNVGVATTAGTIDTAFDVSISGIVTTGVGLGDVVTVTGGNSTVAAGTTVIGIGTDFITVDRTITGISTAGDGAVFTFTRSSQTSEFLNTMRVVSTAGTTITSFTGSTTVADWYSLQTLGLDNAVVYWKNIAEKPGTSQYASERSAKNDEMHVVVVDDSGSVTGIAGNIVEKFTFLSKASDGKRSPTERVYYKSYVATTSDYVYAGAHRTGVSGGLTQSSGVGFTTSAIANCGSEAQGTSFSVDGKRVYNLTGGENYSAQGGFEPTLSNVISSYNILKNPAEYPVNFLINGPSGGSTIQESQAKANKLIEIANLRKDCIACISPHRAGVVNVSDSDTQTTNVINFFDTLTSSSYAVFDSGYKYMYDRFNNEFRYIPCNADVAGLMCRASINEFSWFSPAGASRGTINGAVKLAYNPSQAQRDLIYPKRINPIIASPGAGIILFGDKTALSFASAFDRINVRRLFLTIEDSIERAARAQLFEFNDVITRSNFVNIVEPFLRDVKAKRGITDFVVICDETNNTPDIVDSNQFRADIFVKPARSINFIGLSFVATRTGVSFEEVVGNV